jgi:hypothetical protein
MALNNAAQLKRIVENASIVVHWCAPFGVLEKNTVFSFIGLAHLSAWAVVKDWSALESDKMPL